MVDAAFRLFPGDAALVCGERASPGQRSDEADHRSGADLAPIYRRSVAYLCLTQVRLVAERSCCKGFAAIKTRDKRSDRPLPRSFAALCGFAGEGGWTGAAQLKSLKSGCIAGLVQVPILVS
jgi:hypothetical protein